MSEKMREVSPEILVATLYYYAECANLGSISNIKEDYRKANLKPCGDYSISLL